MSKDENGPDKSQPQHIKGRFAKGNQWGKFRVPKELREIRQATREHVAHVAYGLLDPANNIDEGETLEKSKLEYLRDRAVKTGNYKFIQYLLDQTIGRAVMPILSQKDSKERPTTIIRRTDGSVIEYTLAPEKNTEEEQENEAIAEIVKDE